jgi:hypothetical protein
VPDLVNQPYQVLMWSPLTTIACNCKRSEGRMGLIHIFGFNNATSCPNCGTLYTTKGLMPDGTMVVEATTPSKVVM